MPGSKTRLKKKCDRFCREIIAAVHMQSFEFLRQVEQIEMVLIGSVIDGRLLFTKQCILHELAGRFDSMTVKKPVQMGLKQNNFFRVLRKLREKYGMSQSNAATVLTHPFFLGEVNRGCCLLVHRECILQAVCHRDVLPSPSSTPE